MLDALASPKDDESRLFATKVLPIYTETSSSNPYPELARIVFTAATDNDEEPSPRALVDAWKRRKRGG
jgi:hypothetical protein